ncbi:MAG: NUDIX domain-containing protein [bacterium]
MSGDVVEEISAGVIPYRERDGEVEYLLLSYEQGHWSFPKEGVEEDEEITGAALRILEEETSISAEEVELDTEVERTIEYTFERDGKEHKKTVYLYPGQVAAEAEVNIPPELKDYEWMSFGDATIQMTYPEPRRILEEFHNEKYGEDNDEPLIDTSLLDD